jgi:hypothetical protein
LQSQLRFAYLRLNQEVHMLKSFLSVFIGLHLCFYPIGEAYAGKTNQEIPNEEIQTIHNKIEAHVYGYKKTKYYTAVEIAFTNKLNKYVEFTPKEIYLDDKVKYSKNLLSMDQIKEINQKKPSLAILPTALGIGLGIAALATSRSNDDLTFGLAVAALGMGGAALLTKGLENRAKSGHLIMFENNSIESIKRLPPGMTLGGVLYFSPTKNPSTISIIAKNKRGVVEKKVFPLKKAKKRRSRK